MMRVDIIRGRTRQVYLESSGGDEVTIVEEKRRSDGAWNVTRLSVPRRGLGEALVVIAKAES